MSTTTTAPSLKQLLIDNVQTVGATYAADFGYIPEDKVGACPMGKARTAIEFTAECAGFNMFVVSLLTGKVISRTEEERNAYYSSLNTGPKAIEALNQSVLALAGALQEASDEDLLREVTMPWGMAATVHKAASMAAGHMMYHCGQLNYIQSLFGDDANHWGGE